MMSGIRNPKSEIRNRGLSRRDLMRLSAAGVAGWSMSGWLEQLAYATADDPKRKRACILLWMAGGPSTIDLWDVKASHANGGPTKEIDTNVPGIKIGETLPKMADHMDRMAIIRSMSTKEADHGRATYAMRTGRLPGGPIQYPAMGAFLAKELERPDAELPSFVSIAPNRFLSAGAYGPGFLGPKFAPLVVGEGGFGRGGQDDYERALKVQDLDLPDDVTTKRGMARVKLLDEMETEFLASREGVSTNSHRTAYQRAVTMMRSEAVKAFDLSGEPAKLRDAYGRNRFGQGCLLARRLVERGVPFIEVTLDGWDTHQDNFNSMKRLCGVLDPAWSTLMTDLKDKGLLDTTTIVWMGEFGRTPKINGGKGRDHWAVSWSTVLAGGGVKGGQTYGKTSDDGTKVEEHPVGVPDLLATVCGALGVDHQKQNNSNVGRPIRLVEPTAKPIKEVIA
jgi:hypothetical protein